MRRNYSLAAMPIRRFAKDDWADDILRRMPKKADLGEEATKALTQYVDDAVDR